MHAGATFLRDMFGDRTTSPISIESLANNRNDVKRIPPRVLLSRDTAEIEKFIGQWDQPERAGYFCVATIKPGKRRSKANLDELLCLHQDLDFKGIVEAADEIKRVLRGLPYPPHRVVFSGHGLHCYWYLSEGLKATTESIERIETALKQLADVLAGDRAVCEAARLMRVPGTHNSKNGEWIKVNVVSERSGSYTLDELEKWLSEAKPLLQRVDDGKTHAPVTTTKNFFQVYGRAATAYGSALDVEQLLDSMVYPGNVHTTELQITASLLGRGEPIDNIIPYVIEQIKRRIPESRNWNFNEEVKELRKQCVSWFDKNPELLGMQEELPEWLLKYPKIKQLTNGHDKQEEGVQLKTSGSNKIKTINQVPVKLDCISGEELEKLPLEPVRWVVQDYIMSDVLNGFFGDGGVGKDYLLLQLAIAMACERKWLGKPVSPGKVLYFNVEDRVPRIRWRQHQITQYLKASFIKYPGRLRIVPMVGKATIVASFDSRSGLVHPTPVMTAVRDMVEAYKPDLVIMGNRVNIFGIQQNDDSQARQCIELLNAISLDYGTTLVMPGHVSIRGQGDDSGGSGSGSSGSVQWSNGVRHRLLLSKAKKNKDEEASEEESYGRTLEVLKSNDAPTGLAINMHWSKPDSLYVADNENITVIGAPAKTREEYEKEEEVEFMKMLGKYTAKMVNVSPAQHARNFAPTAFSRDQDCKYRRESGMRTLRRAMDRLFARGVIQSVPTEKSPSRPRPKIVKAPNDAS